MEILREKYINLIIEMLTENVKKTTKLDVGKDLIAHYSLVIEESCYEKCHGLLSYYTKAITAARLNIEKCTASEKLYPTIANALKPDDVANVDGEQEKSKTDDENQLASSSDTFNEQLEQRDVAPKILGDVIVIDSDSDDDLDVMEHEADNSTKIDGNRNLEDDILFSVQTEPCTSPITLD